MLKKRKEIKITMKIITKSVEENLFKESTQLQMKTIEEK
jgi:hypothetical protein